MVPNSEVLATTDTKSFHKLTETEITILKIYCCMAAVMAFSSNLFLIISVGCIRQVRRIPIYVFLINMEISDFLKSFALFGWFYNINTSPNSLSPPTTDALCYILGSLYATTTCGNSCVTSFILLDRLYLLAYPLRYHSTITYRFYCIVNLFNWLIWIAFGFLPLFQQGNMVYERIGGLCQFKLGKIQLSDHQFGILL